MEKGSFFEARQKRFTFEEKHFYVDLVFYNRLLRCYVLIDLKISELSHQDLGQIQMYVNYYDRYVRQEFESPTIGILLCENKVNLVLQLIDFLQSTSRSYHKPIARVLPTNQLIY